MKSPPLTYFPAYLGLFASLSLASTCNSFLYIQQRTFGIEVFFWTAVFASTLLLGWRQQGEVSAAGKRGQKLVFVFGAIIVLFIYIPAWGFPRAGLAILGVLQAGQNCVTVSRRNLHFGLFISTAMTMIATWHYRADWTMLFYLVPYVAFAVFTLVAEQISRRVQDMRRESLYAGSIGGQGVAIGAATTAILAGGALLYAITPQVTWFDLNSKFGQPGNFEGYAPGKERTAQGADGRKSNAGNQSGTGAGMRPGDQRGGHDGGGGETGENGSPEQNGWPALQEMRDAARRPGMPKWQSSAIEGLAGLAETGDMLLTPVSQELKELWNNLKKWLEKHRQAIISFLMTLIALALLIATWRLLKEARVTIWLLSRLDYLRLGLLRQHASGNAGALQYYSALQRLLDLHGMARPQTANSREYLAQIVWRYDHLRREATEATQLFEQARYGNGEVSSADLNRMWENYCRMFRGMDIAESVMK